MKFGTSGIMGCLKVISILSLTFLAAGCAGGKLSFTPLAFNPDGSPKNQQVLISSDGASAKPFAISGKEKVSTVLHDVLPRRRGGDRMTILLVRRCPEGVTREMIDVDAKRTLCDPKQDYALRDGDELVIPLAEATPAGLQRPPSIAEANTY